MKPPAGLGGEAMEPRWQVTLGFAFVIGALFTTWSPASAQGESVEELYRRLSPSTVVIRARGREVTSGGVTRFREIGSGVLISPDGKIATAAHVVHSMEDITVEFLGEDPVPAKVVASEPRADLSLIQVSVVPRDAAVAKIADSNTVRVGEPVLVIGAPYGLRYALSRGVLSARWDANTVTVDFPLAEFFQTDAVINTGNSGGPMFNMAGELIGIVSHNITKSGGSEGLGFAVTANSMKKLMLERPRAWYGVDVQPVTGAQAQALKVPQAGGFLVKNVVRGSLADRLGLRGGDRLGLVEGQEMVLGGDIILKVQGLTVTGGNDIDAIRGVLDRLKPGEDLRVSVLRDGHVVELGRKWTGQ
jgi:serine protease Do